MDWRIYYGDGTTFSSDEGAPQESPAFDVQVIAVRDARVGRLLLTRFDWYFCKAGEWFGVQDVPSLLDHILHDRLREMEAVRMGRVIGNKKYLEIYKCATEDKSFPIKSGRLLEEKPGGSR